MVDIPTWGWAALSVWWLTTLAYLLTVFWPEPRPIVLDNWGTQLRPYELHPELFALYWRPAVTDPDYPYVPPPQAY